MQNERLVTIILLYFREQVRIIRVIYISILFIALKNTQMCSKKQPIMHQKQFFL